MRLATKKSRTGLRPGNPLIVGAATVLAVVCVGITSYSLPVRPATSPGYLGTWRAEYQEMTFMVISLREEKGTMSGSIRMMHTHINLEGDGEVSDVSGELSEPIKLTNLRIEGKSLFFDFREEGDTDAVHCRMEMTAPDKANLQWIELPKGFKFKPIAFAKDKATPGASQ